MSLMLCRQETDRIAEIKSEFWVDKYIEFNHNTRCWSANKYRNMDGTCNNLHHPFRGSIERPFTRLLNADYADGNLHCCQSVNESISSPRISVTRRDLQSAQKLFQTLSPYLQRNANKFTPIVTFWGIFVRNDIMQLTTSQLINENAITCCHSIVVNNPERFKHPECFEFYANDKCIDYIRSAVAVNWNFNQREQLNVQTSYIDASHIYGTNDEIRSQIRLFSNGLLKTSYNQFLPFDDTFCNEFHCNFVFRFKTADNRVNQRLEMIALHTLWIREHNRIATNLKEINKQWSDETIFQEAKRIVTAEIQHITYNEFLPSILGDNVNSELKLEANGFYELYDPRVDVTVNNEFATSAFTFISEKVDLFSNFNQCQHFISNATLLTKAIESSVKYLISNNVIYFENIASQRNAAIVEEKSFGLSLNAWSIQRGRDHGIPSYVHFLHYCLQKRKNHINRVQTWNDFLKLHLFTNETVMLLKKFYESLLDVDLIVGLFLEKKQNNEKLSETLQCILKEQFVRLRKGDRFWYENSDIISSFTEDQLTQIRSITLSTVICRNFVHILRIRRNLFEKRSQFYHYLSHITCIILATKKYSATHYRKWTLIIGPNLPDCLKC
ncbi:peroxidase-like protein [Leptotrombidium deliense]|uniref:Peroxidase-like protein n=1 Tax=Leptotrombidium deliense TaxID=299467 RepID=A0A443SM38_9ACAR|nr:peroxidase-like protein [Leptotrombidium deliense]